MRHTCYKRWGENGEDVAWVKQDFKTYPVNRQYSEAHLKWWFTESWNGGSGVGSKWATCRGRVGRWSADGAYLDEGEVTHDIKDLQLLTTTTSEQLADLQHRLDQNPRKTLTPLSVKPASLQLEHVSSLSASQIVDAGQNPYGLTEGILAKKDEEMARLKEEKESLEKKLVALELKERSLTPPKSKRRHEHSKHKSGVNSPGLFIAPPSSSPVDQVSAMAQAVSEEMNAQDLEALLEGVTEGHLVEVENLLKKNPKLALATGTIKDLSDRTFKNITVFQYAVWALDMEMCEVILKYLDSPIASVQLKALENHPNVTSTYGAHYDFTPLINKNQTYLDYYNQWEDDECCNYWQKEVGGAQRQCPAWLIYAWCEKGKEVAWVKQDFKTYPVNREYSEVHLKWWFKGDCRLTGDYGEGKGVGSKWACSRGRIIGRAQMRGASDWHNFNTIGEATWNKLDLQNLQLLKTSTNEQLEQLKQRLDQNPQSILKK